MESDQDNLFKLSIEEIESKVILLKRRAAEAEFLREERDLLLSKLRLCSTDIIYPEVKSLEVVKAENDGLKAKVSDLEQTVQDFSENIKQLGQYKDEVEVLREENTKLKTQLLNVSSLEEEVSSLNVRLSKMKEDFQTAVSVGNAADPNAKCKDEIRRLCFRAEELQHEKDKLREEVMKKDVKIDVLECKISQLEAKSNQLLLTAEYKKTHGLEVSAEEELMCSIGELKAASKTMTELAASLADKYQMVRSEMAWAKRGVEGRGMEGDGRGKRGEQLEDDRQFAVEEKICRRVLEDDFGWFLDKARPEQGVPGLDTKSSDEVSSGESLVRLTESYPSQAALVRRLKELQATKDDLDKYHAKMKTVRTSITDSRIVRDASEICDR